MHRLDWRAVAVALSVALPRAVLATGAAALAGPATLPRDLVAPDDPAERGLRVFASGLAFRTREDFLSVEADHEGQGFTVGFAKRSAENLAFALSVGSLVGSTLDAGEGTIDLDPSLLVQAAFTWRVLEGYDQDPFVTTTLGFTHGRAKDPDGERLITTDLSLSLAVGKSFLERFAPYLAVKGFAGPHTWTWQGRRVNGHDAYRWSGTVGLVAATEGGLDLQVELAPVGARSVTVAVGGWW